MDALETFKAAQKVGWAHFIPLEAFTTPTAARLVGFAGVKPGQRVLDVACGTGVVAITAAQAGAQACGIDFTPELLERAREHQSISKLDVEWKEADAEALPFPDRTFDVVLSQFGHIFAPRPELAVSEMLRVLKPGGRIAFSTWPPDHYIGQLFALVARYLPAPPGVSPPGQWGEPTIVRERLGAAVRDLTFDRDTMLVPVLTPAHMRFNAEKTVGPTRKVVESLEGDPARLEQFRREFDAQVAQYWTPNLLRQSFLMTRAIRI